MVTTLMACGQESKSKDATNKKNDLLIDYENVQADEAITQEETASEEITTETLEETTVSNEILELSEDWEKLNNKLTGIQIDDKVYYMGMTYEQVIENLEASKVKYEYEVNENELILSHSEKALEIFKNGENG